MWLILFSGSRQAAFIVSLASGKLPSKLYTRVLPKHHHPGVAIAWKVMYLSRLGSECPELSCELIFEPSEWKSVWMTVRKANPPSIPPPLNEMIHMINSLGA